jgi:hypothetical protein
MRIPILTGVLILAGLAALPSRAGVIVYNNDFGGVVSGDDFGLDAWLVTGYSVADSFSLGTSTSLTGINLALWLQASTDTVTSLTWTILDNSDPTNPFGGNVLYSGTVDPTGTFITIGPVRNQIGYTIEEESFGISTGTLTAGTIYWLEISNGATNAGDQVGWDQSDGPSAGYQTVTGSTAGGSFTGLCNGLCTGSESFELLAAGGGGAPEPGTLALLGGGLVGLAAFRRRKK